MSRGSPHCPQGFYQIVSCQNVLGQSTPVDQGNGCFLSAAPFWDRGLREMSHYGRSAQILGHRDTRAGQCRTMCTANVTSCPRNVASADTKRFGKAQSETCGQGDGCALGADPLLRGYHWGM